MSGKGDIIDQANVAAELFNRAATSKRKPEAPKANGFCFNCEARLAAGLRWCDLDCRADYELSKRAELMRPREDDSAA